MSVSSLFGFPGVTSIELLQGHAAWKLSKHPFNHPMSLELRQDPCFLRNKTPSLYKPSLIQCNLVFYIVKYSVFV